MKQQSFLFFRKSKFKTICIMAICWILSMASLQAAKYTVVKTGALAININATGYAAGDTIEVMGATATDTLTTTDWAVLKSPLRNYHLELNTLNTNIPNQALKQSFRLMSINAPNIRTIGYQALYQCTLLTIANFPQANTLGDETFTYCTALTNFSSLQITILGNSTFAYCSNLTNIHLPNLTTMGNLNFVSNTNLPMVSFPLLTAMGENNFRNCSNLTNATFPQVTTIGYGNFWSCTSLTTMSLPLVTAIPDFTFYYCDELVSLNIPNVISLGNSAITYCPKINHINLPNATTLGYACFAFCKILTDVHLPEVTTMAPVSFASCDSLTYVHLPKLTSIANQSFRFCPTLLCLELDAIIPPTVISPAFNNDQALLLIVPDSTAYTPAIMANYPAGSQAFNKKVATEPIYFSQDKGVTLSPNRIPLLTQGTYQWYKNGLPIPGANTTTYQARSEGLYTLEYTRGGGKVMLLSNMVTRQIFNIYGLHSLYQNCINTLTLQFPANAAGKTVHVWTEGSGAGYLYDMDLVKYFKDTLSYQLPATDSILFIHYLIDPEVENASKVLFKYRIAGGAIQQTDTFSLYAQSDIKLLNFYRPTVNFKGLLEISITNGTPFIQWSLDDGNTWKFARDTTSGHLIPFTPRDWADLNENSYILFRQPNTCTPYDTLFLSGIPDPSISRKVILPVIPNAICNKEPGVHVLESRDNFEFTITPTGQNIGRNIQITTSRTLVPDSEGLKVIKNDDGSFTVTIVKIQEPVSVYVSFTVANEPIQDHADVWAHNKELYMRARQKSTANVYNITGKQIHSVTLAPDETVRLPLDKGIYLVSINGSVHKVVIK